MSYDIQSMQVRSGLDLDQDCMIIIPDGLDFLIFGINNLLVKCEDPAGWPGLFDFAY
jgi:hypothetical protein